MQKMVNNQCSIFQSNLEMNDQDSGMESSFTETYERIERILLFRREKCLKQYNQHMKPEDADVTSSIYLQILAIQFIMCVLSVICISTTLILHFYDDEKIMHKSKHMLLILTIIHMISVIMETTCRISWMKEKRAIFFVWKEYLFAFLECLFLVPFPNFWLVGKVYFFNYATWDYHPIEVDSLLSVYLLLRAIYVLKFLVHSESYYGSRPDRLSRYYAVKISNFNAVRFLINEKPFQSISIMYILAMLALTLAMNILEGPINSTFADYYSCLYYFIVSQSTVGYGDMYPVTILGRVISMFMIIVGLFFTSLVLIFIVEELKLSSSQEDTHYLLKRLETQTKMKKAIVKRIKEQYYVKKGYFAPSERKKKIEELAIMRLENRKMMFSSINSEPTNLRRMIMKNFSELHHLVKQFSDKHEFLNEFCLVLLQRAPTKNRFSIRRQTNVTHLYQLLMQKEEDESSDDEH